MRWRAARAGAGPSFLEMKTFRRMQHSMRANLPDVRDPAVLEEWEPRTRSRSFEHELRASGDLDDERIAAIRREVEAEVAAAVESALADEDASADDLLPSVLAAHRRHPQAPPEGERALGFVAAIREALELELEADPDVIVMGEDVGRVGGIFRATEGLYERYGTERIRDTPLTESGFVGCGIGAALTGLRPVVELQFSDFAGVAFDQILNQAAKLRFMTGGAATVPLVLRMVSGGGVRLGAQHSQSLEALFAHIPGLVVVMPSSPYDAKGLLAAAIRDDNPVVFLEQKLLFFDEPAPVPVERYALELGRARARSRGRRRHRRGAGCNGLPCAPSRSRARGRGHRRRGARPADDRAARHGGDRSVGGEDEPGRRRARGRPVRRLRRRDRCAHRPALLLGARRARGARRGAVTPDPVPEGARARDPPRPGGDRRRGSHARRALSAGYESRRSKPSARWSHGTRWVVPAAPSPSRCARYQS